MSKECDPLCCGKRDAYFPIKFVAIFVSFDSVNRDSEIFFIDSERWSNHLEEKGGRNSIQVVIPFLVSPYMPRPRIRRLPVGMGGGDLHSNCDCGKMPLRRQIEMII